MDVVSAVVSSAFPILIFLLPLSDDASAAEAATILEPSRVMSGWVAARVLGKCQ